MNFSSVATVLTFLTLLSSGSAAPAHGEQIRHFNQQRGGQRLKLKYRECGKKYKKAIDIQKLDLLPMPIAIPGLIELKIRANVTNAIPNNVNIKLTLKKRAFDSFWWSIPCISGYGSCRYRDVETCLLTNDIFGCPVQQKYYDVDQVLRLPDPGRIRSFLPGEYRARLKVKHPVTRQILACMNGRFSVTDGKPVVSDEEKRH